MPTTSTRPSKTATNRAAKAETHRGLRFLLPWLGALLLPFIGVWAHHAWGMTLPAAPLAAVGVFAGAIVVATLTYLTAQRSRPDNPLLQWHSVVTTGLVGAALIMTLIVGWRRPWADIYVIAATVLVLTWNVRRFDIFRMDELGALHRDGVMGELGLAIRSRKVVTATPDRAEVTLRMAAGQTVEDVQKVAKNLGSHAGTLRNGVTAVPGKREGEVTLSLEFTDVLEDTIPWPGPSHPGGSIADGLNPGKYQNGRDVWWYPAGEYRKNIAPGHCAVGGMPRSGKAGFTREMVADLSTRRDVWIMGSDTRKGLQFTAPIAPALGWWAENSNAVKAQLRALERAVVARNQALGRCGYESWTPKAYDDPRLRMPAVVYLMEEAAAVLDDVTFLVVELAEAALSAGVVCVFSAQRWSYDRVPVSLRSNISNSVCYGVDDDLSASFLISDSTRAASPDPAEWKTRHPGRALGEFNGVDTTLYPVPFKTYWADRDQALAVVTEWATRMATLDDVTLNAFGDTYTKRPQHTTPNQEDTVDDTPYEDDDDELEVPTMGDPELDEQAADVDPRMPIPSYDGPEVDMNPEPDGRPALSPELRRAEFAGMLADLMDAGRGTGPDGISTDEIVAAWYERVGEVQGNQRPFLHEQLNDRIEQGQVERLGRGRYRLVALAEIGQP